MELSNKEIKDILTDALLCLSIAILVALSFEQCPVLGQNTRTDSSVFLYVGNMMLNGKFPYVDAFDHKGILLYFIQYIGLKFSGGSPTGVWLIEILNLFVVLWFMKKIAELVTSNKILVYISLIIVFWCGKNIFEGGNFTEEYALPWLTIALYVFLKYLIQDCYRLYEIVFLGIGFSIVILLRVNIISVWLAFIPIVIVKMLLKKEWSSIFICFISFVIGILIVGIPVLIYLLQNNMLQEMIECYFSFNLTYTRDQVGIYNYIRAICRFAYLLKEGLIIVALTIWSNRKNKLYWHNVWFVIVSLPFMLISGRLYSHYAIVLLPGLVIPCIYFVVCINSLLKEQYQIKNINRNIVVNLLCIVIVTIVVGIKLAEGVFVQGIRQSADKSGDNAIEYLIDNTEASDNVLVLGNRARCYLKSKRYYKNKYFYQEPIIEVSEKVFEEFFQELVDDFPDYIISFVKKENALEQQGNMGYVYQYLDTLEKERKVEYIIEDGFYVYKKK